MFWKRPTIDLTEYKEEIKKLEKRISELEKDIIDVLAQQKQIRDKVLRRFRGDFTQETPEETEIIKSFNPFKP